MLWCERGGEGGGGGRLKGIPKELCIAVLTIKLYDTWLLEKVGNFLVCNFKAINCIS